METFPDEIESQIRTDRRQHLKPGNKPLIKYTLSNPSHERKIRGSENGVSTLKHPINYYIHHLCLVEVKLNVNFSTANTDNEKWNDYEGINQAHKRL